MILVPTPSADDTSTGFFQRFLGNLKRPPKEPRSPSTWLLNVARTLAFMRCTASIPASILTPAAL
jgi:hypothetical protein